MFNRDGLINKTCKTRHQKKGKKKLKSEQEEQIIIHEWWRVWTNTNNKCCQFN